MTRHLLTSGLFAGVATGLIAALLQFWLVIPLLLEGELFESGLRSHFAASPDGPTESPAGPAEGMNIDYGRDLRTAGFDMVAYTAFAMILVAGMALARRFGHHLTVRRGVIWGIAGFVVMHLSPAIGLPPEMPGMINAPIELRQVWWLATVLSTGIGLALLVFGSGLLPVIGIVALVLPHAVGAPHLDTYFGVAPPELAALFVARSLGVAAATWVVLGCLCAYFLNRFQKDQSHG
jgi:cobalt transporter subunit CbtA